MFSFAPPSLPAGAVQSAYDQTIVATGGNGTVTLSYSILSGSIPAGLTFDTTSHPGELLITGMPTAPGGVAFTVVATDSQDDVGGKVYQLVVPRSITVTSTSNDPTVTGSLPWAVAQANADTSGAPVIIGFDPALGAATINLAGTLDLNNTTLGESIEIDGSPSGITIAGGGAGSNFSVMTVEQGTTVLCNEVTISNGINPSVGGGIDNNGTLTLTNSTVSDNSAGSGGGIESSGSLTLIGSTISGNSSVAEGGGIACTLLIATDCIFSDNSATMSAGGAIDVANGTATITGCTLSGNTAVEGGGAPSPTRTQTRVR